jgi:hypothetical protein
VRALASILAALACAVPAPAQDEPAFEKLEMRVTSTRPGGAGVDRGSEDGLALGDAVTFFPREGGVFPGTVVEIDARSAVVQLVDPRFVPQPGTRAEARVPVERRPAQAQPTTRPAAPEHPPWENRDEKFAPGLPLLSRADAVRPEDRPRYLYGRLYAVADQTWTTEEGRSDGFYRLGGGAILENPIGRGGRFQLEGETNYRYWRTPGPEDGDDFETRLDRLSYLWGETRFSKDRWEVGRFLQQGMPEFGVVDGAEWGHRTVRGWRYGASAGYMPEPDADYDSFEDFQVAGYFQWFADESERLSFAAGYQKSFHDGDADRDLAVVRAHYLPPEGWTLQGTAWIDFYTAGDDAKGPGVSLTQAYANAGRRWASGNGVQFTYSHLEFPEMDREEFTPVNANQLADDHYDRIAAQGWRWWTKKVRVSGELAGWVDEDKTGGDAEVGLEWKDLVLDRSRANFALFGNEGRYGPTVGARIGYGAEAENGRWHAFYEFAYYEHDDFTVQDDEIFQHRVRASRDFTIGKGWNVSAYLQGFYWEDETAVSGGFYMQKTF